MVEQHDFGRTLATRIDSPLPNLVFWQGTANGETVGTTTTKGMELFVQSIDEPRYLGVALVNESGDVIAFNAPLRPSALAHDVPPWTPPVIDPKKACGKAVHWWNGEYEGECELMPANHKGLHFDGTFWFDDDNEEAEPPAASTLDEDLIEYLHRQVDADERVALAARNQLGEVAANRKLVERADELVSLGAEGGYVELIEEYRIRILPALAAKYVDRPGFLEKWRP